jgi:hypothetical protein
VEKMQGYRLRATGCRLSASGDARDDGDDVPEPEEGGEERDNPEANNDGPGPAEDPGPRRDHCRQRADDEGEDADAGRKGQGHVLLIGSRVPGFQCQGSGR